MKTANKIAELLLQSNAIKLDIKTPYTWTSGWKSPIYCDNRKTLSYPVIRTHIRNGYISSIKEYFDLPDLIAGVATGAIAQGALVADKMGLPFIYVRSAPKGHGMKNLIEGVYEKGQTVIVIEDLVSTGGSSLKAVEALRDAGCLVTGMIATFTYGFQKAKENFAKNGITLYTLTDYETMISQAVKSGYISQEMLPQLRKWRDDPETWMR